MRTSVLALKKALVVISFALTVPLALGCGTDGTRGSESAAQPSAVIDDTTNTPEPTDQIARLEERLESLTYNHDDKIMLEISKRVPEWGGYFGAEGGAIHIYLTDLSRTDEARDVLAQELSGRFQFGRVLTGEDLIVEQSQFTMLQLLEWFWLTDFQPVFLQSDPEVVSIAVQEADNRIAIDLAAEEYRDGAVAKLRELGVPEEAVQFTVTGPAQRGLGAKDQIARLEERLGSLTYNDDDKVMLEISERLPDWGGFYLAEDGRYHVYMTDPAAAEDMRADVAAVLSGAVWGYVIDHEGTAREQRLSLTADDVVIVKGQYTMLQLLEWYWLTDFMPVLMRPGSGGVASAVAENSNRLILDLEAEEYREGVLTNLREMDIPLEAVHISVTGPAIPDAAPPIG